jgi:hypothetical protein
MSITQDIEAARKTLHRLTMKTLSLENHAAALSALVASQNAAALALQSRIANAERIKAAFAAAPSESTIAGAVAAVAELDALNTLQSALPPAEHRERSVRDDYCRRHRDELLDILTADLSNRLKTRPAWRRAIAGQIAKLSEALALREAPQAELAAASTEADRLDGTLAASDHAEREARRSIADFANAPSFTTLNDARGIIGTLNF